jgi:electron transport complex protein RnfG
MTIPKEPAYRERMGYQAGLLGGFTLMAAAFLVLGNIATKDAIEQRRMEDLMASLSQVVPQEIHDNDLLQTPLSLPDANGEPVTVYRALRGGQVSGVAYQVVGQGYAGAINLILAVDPDGRVISTRVLSHAETPGLGDKIEAERDDWILGFDGLSLSNPPAERWTVIKDGGEFDQFTGATITPRAVVLALKRGLEFFHQYRDALLAPPVSQESTTDSISEVEKP